MTDKLLPQRPVNQDRGSEMRILQSSTMSSKYGRFWLRQNQDGDGYNAKLEANDDILVASSTSFIKSMLANLQSTSSILCTARSLFPVERSLRSHAAMRAASVCYAKFPCFAAKVQLS